MRKFLFPVFSVTLLGLLSATAIQLHRSARRLDTVKAALDRDVSQLAPTVEHLEAALTLKNTDIAHVKSAFVGTVKSQKDLLESGLSLQEERRLLEKQLEIMTTTLSINAALQRIFLLRGDQPLQSYLIRYFPLRAFGGAPATLPVAVRIVSKERFAHPERGQSEVVNGQLQWTPPQVGTSVRARALGEFVLFTNSKLILHGPPISAEDHEKFPHICLGLDLDSARRLYRASFIGTRIKLAEASIVPVPMAANGLGITTSSATTTVAPALR